MTELGTNAGRAYIPVTPSLKNWDRNVQRQLDQTKPVTLRVAGPDANTTRRLGERSGDDFAGGFDRSVRKRISAALAALPKTQIGASTDEAEQKIRDLRHELEVLNGKRIGVDVDAGAAVARLDEIRVELERLSAESVNIDVKADTILAMTQLAAVHHEVNALDRDTARISVDVDRNGFTVLSSALAGLTQQTSGLRSGIGMVAIAGLALIPVAAILASIGATLAVTLTAATAGGAALLVGLLGNLIPVIKAHSELKQKQQEAASAATSLASAQNSVRSAVEGLTAAEISASRAIADAQRALADAHRQAARSIAAAEDSVAQAQLRRRDAQQALDAAIEEAKKKLADYQLQLRGAALDESGAALSVTQAQEALNEVLSDPTATQLQIDLARQSLKEAQLSYDEATKRRRDLREQARKDRKAGIDGDQGVLAAKEQLAAANHDLAQSETRLGQARADAARSVADAQRNLGRARADAARSVAQAREQVAQAREAEAAAEVKYAAAQQEVAKRMALMTGPAAVFLKVMARAKSVWKDFLAAVAPATFGLAGTALKLFIQLLPQLEPLVRRSARAVGRLLTGFGEFAEGKTGQRFLHWMTKAAPRAIVVVGRAIGNILVGIGGLLGAIADTDTGFFNLTKRFANFGRHAGKNSAVQGFFRFVQKASPIVARALGTIWQTIVRLVKAAAPVGLVVLKVFGLLAAVINHIPVDVLTAIIGGLVALAVAGGIAAAVIAVLAASAEAVIGAILSLAVAAGVAVVILVAKSEFLRKGFIRAWTPVWRAVKFGWEKIIKPALHGMWWLITKVLAPAVVGLWNHVVKPYFRLIGAYIQQVWKRFIHPALQVFWWFITKVLAPTLQWLWEHVVRPVFGKVGDFIAATWDRVIKPVFEALKDFLHDHVVPAFRTGMDAITKIWDGLKKAAGTPVKFVVDTVYNNGIRKVINALPGVTDVDPVDTSGWPSFASGGVLPGYTPGRDVHRFVSPTAGILNLSGGEGILIPQAVRQLGGRAGIGLLNKLARLGRLSIGALIEQSHASGGIVYVDGQKMTPLAAAQLAVAENAAGFPMRVIQGSYQPFTSFSGASHMGGGVMDTAPGSFAAQAWLRKLAFAAWARNIPGAAYAGSGAHVHSVSLIDPTVTNHSQPASYQAGGDGLGGRDYGPRPGINQALVRRAVALAGAAGHFNVGATATGSATSTGGNPFKRFFNAVDAAKDFATSFPGWISKLSHLGGWAHMLVGVAKSIGRSTAQWVNDKIPNRFLPNNPIPLSLFDSGGLARGRGTLAKGTIEPERVLSPAQTAAFERQVATLEGWDRTARLLSAANITPSSTPTQIVGRVRIVDYEQGIAEIEAIADDAATRAVSGDHAVRARVHDLDLVHGS